MHKYPEILAPVGSWDALIAAVRSGADAVYFGTGECNARRNAGRFEGEALDEAVRYCHARGVLTYLTVNTLLRDEELKTAAQTIERIAQSGADAIIIQDLAIASLAKRICPSLSLHASTQMAVHNAAGVLVLEQMGFSRVVLARELSRDEIASIRGQTQMELEAFVHGALCMSASGMCYLSSSLGERSGNRGTCAQPCRLPFQCGDAMNCLSLKDMSHLPYIVELGTIGVTSCKIEGRMKRPEYVAAAVNAARCSRDGEPYETEHLRDVFSRSGFTDGYYLGNRDGTMFGVRTQEDAQRSKAALASFRELYRGERAAVPIAAQLTAHKNKQVLLTVSDGTHTTTAFGAAPEIAERSPSTREKLWSHIKKTGGTPFFLPSIDAFSCKMDADITVLPSVVNALRREALEKLLKLREEPPMRSIYSAASESPGAGRNCAAPEYAVRFASARQAFSDDRIRYRSLPVEELLRFPEQIDGRTACELPDLCYPKDEERLLRDLKLLRERGVKDAVAGNLGTIELAHAAGLFVHGGYGLNITNHLSCQMYADLGLKSLLASFELPYPKIRDLHSPIPLGCMVAGHLPLMQLRACPARSGRGCASCTGAPVITDRMGRSFPLICHEKRYTTMLNGVLYDTADKPLPKTDYYLIYLTVESKEQAKRLTESVLRGEKPDGERTTGMSFRTLI